jgi:hypothetical protein
VVVVDVFGTGCVVVVVLAVSDGAVTGAVGVIGAG